MSNQNLITFKRKAFLLTILVVAIGIFVFCGKKKEELAIPETRTDTVTETIHGVEIVDPYRWLENQDSSDTRAWIDAQNEYTHSILDELPGRDKLEKRLTELIKTDRISIPTEQNGRYFLRKRAADQEQWVIYMREGLDGEDEVLIDPHPMSEDHTTSVRMIDVSKDGTLMVYGIQEGGEDEMSVRIFDVDERQDVADQLPKARYFGVSLKPDKSGFYYTKHNNEKWVPILLRISSYLVMVMVRKRYYLPACQKMAAICSFMCCLVLPPKFLSFMFRI